MADEHRRPHELDEADDATRRAEQRHASERAFNWPPTMEELDSIQVLAMRDVPAGPSQESPRESPQKSLQLAPMSRTRPMMPLVSAPGEQGTPTPTLWRRVVEESMVAQAGLLAASLAAIGIAVTSLLAPAQPAARSARTDARPAIAAPTPAPPPMPAIALPGAPPEFHQVATLETPPREESPWLQPRHGGSPAVAPRASGLRASGPEAREADPEPPLPRELTPATRDSANAAAQANATRRPSAARSADRRGARRAGAGSDPVSRFAVRTGSSFLKALRVVGRSFKRDDDDAWSSRPRARAAVARRTAAAVDLQADSAPSAR